MAVPPLKKPYKVRRAQESERRAVREMEREMKEAKDKEKEVIYPSLLLTTSNHPGQLFLLPRV